MYVNIMWLKFLLVYNSWIRLIYLNPTVSFYSKRATRPANFLPVWTLKTKEKFVPNIICLTLTEKEEILNENW